MRERSFGDNRTAERQINDHCRRIPRRRCPGLIAEADRERPDAGFLGQLCQIVFPTLLKTVLKLLPTN